MIKDYGLANYYKNKSNISAEGRNPILGLSVENSNIQLGRSLYEKSQRRPGDDFQFSIDARKSMANTPQQTIQWQMAKETQLDRNTANKDMY